MNFEFTKEEVDFLMYAVHKQQEVVAGNPIAKNIVDSCNNLKRRFRDELLKERIGNMTREKILLALANHYINVIDRPDYDSWELDDLRNELFQKLR